MEVLALIPARGGSKGLPRKNVLPLAGRPLIAHSIQHALDARTITRTVVSTDDAEIAAAARSAGAEVPFIRPPELAGDLATDLEVFRHALETLAVEGYEPELVVHLRPTTPLRRAARIDEAVELLVGDPEADSLRSVSKPVQTPYKMWRLQGSYLVPLLPLRGVEAVNMPRQALPEVWAHDGYVDVVRPRTVLQLGSMTGARVLPFYVDEPVVDVDSADDLRRAEELLRG